MLYIVDRLFEDDFDMKMERVSLIIRSKTAFVMDKKRQTGLFFSLFVSFGGEEGIRTLVACAKRFSRPPRYDRFDTSP